MMPSKWIIFVVLIIVQINYVSTWSILLNCTDCDTRLGDSKQLVDTYRIEQSKIESDSMPIDVRAITDSPTITSATEEQLSTIPVDMTNLATDENTAFSEKTTTTIDNTVTSTTARTTNPITQDNRSTTTTSSPESKTNLGLILGLTLGLGIPICLLIIGGLIYYFTRYRYKHSQIIPSNIK